MRPGRRVLVRQPERAGQERVLARRAARRLRTRCDSAAAGRRAGGRARARRPCPASAGRRRRRSRSAAAAAARRRPRWCRSTARTCCARCRTRGARSRRAVRRAVRPSVRPGPSSPCSRTARMPQSKAAQSIAREWVKCCSSPRISQMPLSRAVEVLLDVVEQGELQRPREVVVGDSDRARLLEGEHDLAEHVALELQVRRVADAHRARRRGSRAAIVSSDLGQPALAARART